VQENGGIGSASNPADIDEPLLLPTESPIDNASVLALNMSALPGMNSTSESEIPYPNVPANTATYQPGDSSYGLLFLFMAIVRYIM
jgi:hypothetical protein